MLTKRIKMFNKTFCGLTLGNIKVVVGIEEVLVGRETDLDLSLEIISSHIAMIQKMRRQDIDEEVNKYRAKITAKIEKMEESRNIDELINTLRDLYMKVRDIKTNRRLAKEKNANA